MGIRQVFVNNLRLMFKSNKCYIPFWYKTLLHFINFLFIFGGWIFVAHWFDLIFSFNNGASSIILSLVILFIVNFTLVIFAPKKEKP